MDDMDLATATPVEIDTALAEIYRRYYAERAKADQAARQFRDYQETLEKHREANLSWSTHTEEGLERLRTRVQEHRDTASVIMAESHPYQAEYNRRPWSRFFLVRNNGGHIHSSMGCSTCYPTTEFGWLPEVSGQTEAEAVAAHGAILCTVCFPTAPVEYTDRRDDSVCPGSGQYYNADLPHRGPRYASGNWATCEACGERQTMMKSGKIRKHKRAEA